MKLHKNTVTKRVYETLKKIQSNSAFDKFYLAGGTSLALQLGHRKSIDLDLFTKDDFEANLITQLDIVYNAVNIDKNSIEIFSGEIKIEFLLYAYEQYEDLVKVERLRLLSPLDVGLHKLLAIQGRSTKKDIIDLFFIDKKVIKLEELLAIFEKHFPGDSFNSYSSFKKLTNEKEVLESKMPVMIQEIDFEEAYKMVKSKITKHIQKLIES